MIRDRSWRRDELQKKKSALAARLRPITSPDNHNIHLADGHDECICCSRSIEAAGQCPAVLPGSASRTLGLPTVRIYCRFAKLFSRLKIAVSPTTARSTMAAAAGRGWCSSSNVGNPFAAQGRMANFCQARRGPRRFPHPGGHHT